MFEAAYNAWFVVLQPNVMAALMVGIAIGTFVAIAPQGLGTPLAYSLLIPIAVTLPPPVAIALLLGMDGVTSFGDSFLPVLFGIPGGAGSQAIILDGGALGRRGEARRALGAGFTASMISALFSVFVWIIAVPVIGSILPWIGSPELFILVLWGMSTVAVLAGARPVKGLIVACFGLLIGTVGLEPFTGVERYMFGQPYLLDGIDIPVITLGLFGIPAALDLVLRKLGVEQDSVKLVGSLWEGVKDAFRHIRLVIQSSLVGLWVGFMPGLGAHIADWLAYGLAAQTCKGARETFGKGDIRGVIAPDAANSSMDCGGLIPTTLLGVPGSLTKAFFMLALIMMGITPGPDMMDKHIELLFVMIWVMFWASLIGGLSCMVFIKPFAKVAELRYTVLAPLIVGLGFVGSFGSNRHIGDLVVFIGSGMLGLLMLRYSYPRAPLVLGLILGAILEKYLYISVQRYGFAWLARPQIMILLPIVVGLFMYTLLSNRRRLDAVEETALPEKD
ncbi:MAG: tripartite tricarboxylate transporter permease [Deltaproteobacteria bacterium]|nr:tripartite tricarboxylate transporter permease [Deltaproteobacteria bacterium]